MAPPGLVLHHGPHDSRTGERRRQKARTYGYDPGDRIVSADPPMFSHIVEGELIGRVFQGRKVACRYDG